MEHGTIERRGHDRETARRDAPAAAERFGTIVIGAGQAGLAAGYHLKRRGLSFLILDANERIGDAWRNRWDSLRLFTPAAYDGLPGMKYPAHPHYFPTKDEFADFLESYASRFRLPVRLGTRVDRLTKRGDRFVVWAGDRRLEADTVIVAMSTYQEPYTPGFADELDPAIVQLHSVDYCSPDQLQAGRVVLVGAGNSGAEIARELAPRHEVWLSGRDVGEIPFRPRSRVGRILMVPVLRFLYHRVLTVDTALGRRVRSKALGRSGPLIRVKRRDLDAAGVHRVGRTAGVRDGMPVLEDGRLLEVENLVWCTGYRPGFEKWIDLPVHGDDPHEPRHERGVSTDVSGLYFVGLFFQRALSSDMIQGAGRDARHVVDAIAERSGAVA
jgi:putative flavoprotein involved in K+ transport